MLSIQQNIYCTQITPIENTKQPSIGGLCTVFNASSSPPQMNAYEEPVANQYGALAKKLFRSPVKHVYNSVNKPKQSIKISKVDISSFANHFDLVPELKGFSKTALMQLYVAKCQDLKINPTKQQMVRFFDII